MTRGPRRSERRAAADRFSRRLAIVFVILAHPPAVRAEDPPQQRAPLPLYLSDRGPGMATSLFGTYVRSGEWLVYAFYEYTRTSQFEYKPGELGFVGNEDFLGTLREHESLLFVARGLTDRMMIEVESALQNRASFLKDPADLSGVPNRLDESGLGDTEGEFRWRWSDESEHRPELFSFLEVVLPLQKDKVLIGTRDWEYNLGLGVIKGHRWGTLTGCAALTYDRADGTFDMGEYAIEYLKRVSRVWRFVGAVEGESDELQVIVEAQARLGPHVLLKLNSGFGVTPKAPDVTPEAGVLLSW